MKKSVKVRKIIFEILYEIHQKSINFEKSYLSLTKNINLNEQERSMVYNIVLNSIRYNFSINKILSIYLKKRTSFKIKVLLLSAITQILYLDFKNYAVTNDSVEVAKIKKLNPGLINSLLKNISNDSKLINKNEIDKTAVPAWFISELEKSKINLSKILLNFNKEPSLHLVFKNKKFLKFFKEKHLNTTEISAFIARKTKITEIENYYNGHWWVQDFSSMLPIYLSPEFKSKKIIDICASPGGKAFQVLSLENEVVLNDVSKKRVHRLNENLNRLNFQTTVSNLDALDLPEKQSYDVVILDSPCSGIGTIRRNPEILFKKTPPNIGQLVKIQRNLINKATKLIKKQGIIIYMVCSFFYSETKAIKNKFLSENKNFSQYKFKTDKENELYKFIDKDGDIYCTPTEFKNYMVDGFYAVKFTKND